MTESVESVEKEADSARERIFAAAARSLESRLPPPRGAAAAALYALTHARTQPGYFAGLSVEKAADQAVSLFEFLDGPGDGFRVRAAVEPPPSRRGKKKTVLETAGPDQPFIVDSLLEIIRVRGYPILEAFHPIVAVERDANGRVTAVGPVKKGAELLSLVRIELEGALPEKDLASLKSEADAVLAEARTVVRDFEPMLERLRALEDSLAGRTETLADGEERAAMKEAVAFLAWLRRANFVFLGCREYRLRGAGSSAVLEVEPGSGLGLLGDGIPAPIEESRMLTELAGGVKEPIPRLILVHKTNLESRVIRRARMDFIGVKKLDTNGKVIGEHVFFGLFTARAYNDLPSDIPILRKKLDAILERANVVTGSHDHKEIFSIFTSIPKSELFATDTEKIAEMIFTVMSGARRRDVRVSYRPDLLERGVSVMVLLPRERFNAEARIAIQKLLAAEFKGTPVDYRLALSEEPMARLHFYFATPPGKLAEPPLDALEAKVAEITRTWEDRLREALEREHGSEEGHRIAERYAKAFPAAYYTQKSPDTAVTDIRHIEKVLAAGAGAIEAAVAQGKGQTHQRVSILKIFRPEEPFALSALMPIFTHLDLQVLDEQTFRVAPRFGGSDGARPRGVKSGRQPAEVFLHSFRVLTSAGEPLPPGSVTRNVEQTILGVLAGEVEDDPLNALVTRAGLDPREADLLRAYDAYLLQLGTHWTQRTTYAALYKNPEPAALLVKLFQTRFDPRGAAGDRARAEEEVRAAFRRSLEKAGIHEDQILRFFENLILTSVRTNYFLVDEAGKRLPALSIKLRCAAVQMMPEPRPLYEIFVHGSGLEGVHLRSGKVARGGIRWSSRIDDYRMEILGLMKAQRTKNAVIVPVGAKGGFILKKASPTSPPPEEIRRQYEVFIGALLDVTDNIVDGKVIHPAGVVIHDEPDPYHVVAADRGTAGFSDIANGIATSRSFWLADAFASGGSRGYNHKKEGITARGVWECVRRHFREMGRNPDRETFTVAGIGDMSGDVFGNGLIYSRNTLLLAAVNHLHIFLDPSPDPAVSFEERRRLFDLALGWDHYEKAKISRGGGVHRRDSKSIAISPEARGVLGIAAETLNGEELVSAILRMPVDLLWNGGIGTYVKARTESHEDVGDPTNDAVRVDGADLRVKIVAEGGNLGFTQLGRIEYARLGGHINTDFIDNSAGVDLSDHEVNLKILLIGAEARGSIPPRERDKVLRAATAEVSSRVLRDNYLQGRVISLEERRAPLLIEEHRFLIEDLEATGLLNRAVEKIPGTEQLIRLRNSAVGLARPHLATLLAYAKIDSYLRILATALPDGPELEGLVIEYFPAAVASRFREEIRHHRLRREIAATTAANAAINEMGITFFHRVSRRAGAGFDDVLRAYLVATVLARTGAFEEAAGHLYAEGIRDIDTLYGAHDRFRAAEEEVVLGVLRRGLGSAAPERTIADYSKRTGELRALSAKIDGLASRASPGRTSIIPPPLVEPLLHAERLAELMDLADLREGKEVPPELALEAWEAAASDLYLDRVEVEAERVPRLTAEDIQTCIRLVEEAREHRRNLAGRMLERLADGGAISAPGPSRNTERARVLRMLEAARTREPLTATGLFVIVEALGRIASTGRS